MAYGEGGMKVEMGQPLSLVKAKVKGAWRGCEVG